MIFGAFRIGRYAMRAGQQQGPPQQFGIFGKTVCLLLFASVFAHWWRASLIGLGVTVFFVLPVVLIIGAGKRQAPKDDPLKRYFEQHDGTEK